MTGRETPVEWLEKCTQMAGHAPVFEFRGHAQSCLPVLLTVPHAGRDYSLPLLDRARVPMAVLRRLEDRFADLLIDDAIEAGCSAVVARPARAAIDLNRDPRDIDPRTVVAIPRGTALIQSVKQRGGLGLFPRSLPRAGEIWRAPMPWDEAVLRIQDVHEPYHIAIEERLRAICASHSCALMLDVHSMPPIVTPQSGQPRPDIVIGDRFGTSAATRYADIARSVISGHGYRCAVNHPYSGYYVLDRHGSPMRGVHALQIEISRDLYLDDSLDLPGRGLAAIRLMFADLACALAEEAGHGTMPIAAE